MTLYGGDGSDMEERQRTDSERIVRLESAVDTIGREVHTMSRSITQLVEAISTVRNQQGRHDWRTMAAWTGVVLTVIVPMIMFTFTLGAREISSLETYAVSHAAIEGHPGMVARVSRSESEHNANSVLINMARDESARWDKLIGAKVGIDVPPPVYFAPTH